MIGGTIQKTIHFLKIALEKLAADISLIELERIAIMVNRAMTAQARSFHTPEHVFDLADITNPYLTLAAVFHDIVYFQVDHGFTPEVEALVRPYVKIAGDELFIRETVPENERIFHVTVRLFGLKEGEQLSPMQGMNEFLSALVMNKKLEHLIPEIDLFRISVCIEATIPFRGPDAEGRNPAQAMEARLRAMNSDGLIGCSEETMQRTIQWATQFANSDVGNFSEEDVARFLDNTWKLLPETNPSLRLTGIYTIRSYRVALQKMEGFLQFLNPDYIYTRYEGVPGDADYTRMCELARRNVTVARKYLGMKLLTAAILEGLAEVSGGDAPVSLFMGEINPQQDYLRFDSMLPDPPERSSDNHDQVLDDLLAFGRASKSSFDLKNSPLSLYIYRCLGERRFLEYLADTRECLKSDCDAEAFLDKMPKALIKVIARACGEMTLSRRETLAAFADSL